MNIVKRCISYDFVQQWPEISEKKSDCKSQDTLYDLKLLSLVTVTKLTYSLHE